MRGVIEADVFTVTCASMCEVEQSPIEQVEAVPFEHMQERDEVT